MKTLLPISNVFSPAVGPVLAALALFGAGLTSGYAQNPNSIVFSKHNLSISGTGSTRATTESDICIFCHTPHHASTDGPLWNHQMSVATYTPYSSSTLKATVGQPTGASRLCLSCHDGTVALGSVHSRVAPIGMTTTTMPAANNVGTDLSADHPISFVYDSALVTKDGHLRDPSTLQNEVRLDRSGQVQCTSCHDPHSEQYVYFLVMDNTRSALCVQCHNMSAWALSSHAISGQPLPAALQRQLSSNSKSAPARTVANAGCASCHVSHAAGAKQQLMKFSAPEENCLSCHSADGPAQNVMGDFKKISSHPILVNSRMHFAQEDPVNPATRHVTCADCHNPHASTSAPGSQSRVSGALAGVAGVSAGGAVLQAVTREYELCFRCHADSSNRGAATVARQWPETNKRLQFNPANQSFHPVVTMGRNPNVPSLITPWTASSLMTCADCHSGDQSGLKAGQVSRAPHGSIYPPLLERQLLLKDYNAESAANYALCYKCHSRESILGDQSFRASNALGQDRGHRFHIVDQKAACTTCHDAHGVVNNPGLINFNTEYVAPASNGQLQFVGGARGPYSGTCTLKCHGKDHLAAAYPNPSSAVMRSRRR